MRHQDHQGDERHQDNATLRPQETGDRRGGRRRRGRDIDVDGSHNILYTPDRINDGDIAMEHIGARVTWAVTCHPLGISSVTARNNSQALQNSGCLTGLKPCDLNPAKYRQATLFVPDGLLMTDRQRWASRFSRETYRPRALALVAIGLLFLPLAEQYWPSTLSSSPPLFPLIYLSVANLYIHLSH